MKTGKKRRISRWLAAALALLLAVGSAAPAGAVSAGELSAALSACVNHSYAAVPAPKPGSSMGGEWTVIALARGSSRVPQAYFRDFTDALTRYVKGKNGVLHPVKSTEYSRTVLALTALGEDPSSVGGFDLLAPLGDFRGTLAQGINGAIWALIALDSGCYRIPAAPKGAVQGTRQNYLRAVLDAQLPDGGWSLTGREPGDPDLTAMALQALAPYRRQQTAARAAEKGLRFLSEIHSGAEGNYAGANAESAAQTVLALCALGVKPGDSRFMRDGTDPLDELLTYRLNDGSFRHVAGAGPSRMATEQGLLALTAASRAAEGKASVYCMASGREPGSRGLPGRHPDVLWQPVRFPERTFADMKNDPARPAAEALASRGIVAGTGGGLFSPELTVTRAEFAAAEVQALGLPPAPAAGFRDVPEKKWFAPYVNTAYAYGLCSGEGNGQFSPMHPVTVQEAAVMAAKAGRLCGLGDVPGGQETGKLLAAWTHGGETARWAESSMAFCFRNGLLTASDDLRPEAPLSRGEMAELIAAVLDAALLLER